MLGKALGLSESLIEAHESSLIRLYLEYCKRGKCLNCFISEFCSKKRV